METFLSILVILSCILLGIVILIALVSATNVLFLLIKSIVEKWK